MNPIYKQNAKIGMILDGVSCIESRLERARDAYCKDLHVMSDIISCVRLVRTVRINQHLMSDVTICLVFFERNHSNFP